MRSIRAISLILAGAFLRTFLQAQTIPDQIDAILARSAVVGNSWTVLVENKDGSVILYQRSPTTGLAPASNTKIFTTSAAFGLFGTNYAFQTRVYYSGTLAGGVLTGNLNLVSEHDPTWNTSVFSGNARAALDRIRRETEQALTAAVGPTAAKEFFRQDRGWARNTFGARGAKR